MFSFLFFIFSGFLQSILIQACSKCRTLIPSSQNCISPGTVRPLSKSHRKTSTRLQSSELSMPLSLGAISVAIKQAIT